MKLSIVTTLYGSASYIEEFHRRITAAAEPITPDFEIVFVNDGSPDNSLEKALGLQASDRRIRVVDLSRNFGHHKAMLAGLEHARGDFVFLIDVDLEEPPELLTTFWAEVDGNPELDVIYGESAQKRQPFFKKLLSKSFYFAFNSLSPLKISSTELVARLMRRRYVDALLMYAEKEIFIPGLWRDAGFRQKPLPAEKSYKGNSNYSMRRRIVMAVDAITSFSSKPLLFVFYSGALMTLASTLFILYMIVRRIFFSAALGGWTSIMASIYLTSGLIIFSLGVVGIYLSKIYAEVKNRPVTIVKKVYDNDHE